MRTLILRQVPGAAPPEFQVMQPAGRSTEPRPVPPAGGFPVAGRPDGCLLHELRWYLEEFLSYPFPPETERAERVLAALRGWGEAAFAALFGDRDGGGMLDHATAEGHASLRIQVWSDDPRVLAWPWEALYDPRVGPLGQMAQIERRLDRVGDPPPLAPDLPAGRVCILLVTARPFQEDVAYRSISRPLVELIARLELPAEVHVLRPPTLERLREHLRERPHGYHVLHFDGHGTYAADGAPAALAASAHTFRGPEGMLLLEDEQGGPAPVGAEQLAPLLREFAVPVVVLNACRSGMLDEGAADAFASVAGALLQSGARSVVAMAYTVYVSAAQRFLPAFYRRLFESGSVAEGVRAGRQEMLADPGRVCARGRFPLRDWLVPVLYQQEDVLLPLGGRAGASRAGQESGGDGSAGTAPVIPAAPATPGDTGRAPRLVELGGEESPYGFVGRDGPLLRLERALRRRPAVLLVHGLAGVGKTTLARGFVEWLRDTGGLGAGCLWFDFRKGIRSAEHVLNRAGELFVGPTFATLGRKEKVERLAGALRRVPLLLVWDNFEAVAGIPGSDVALDLPEEDRASLRALLRGLRGGASKVLLTSRSEESWLGEERLVVPLGGLTGEERWELCERVLVDLGARVDRDDPDLVELMDLLDGHPLAMRLVLPQLAAGRRAGEVTRALREGAAEFAGDDEEQARLYATLRLAETSLPEELRPLLVLLALHEGHVDADLLEWMAREADPGWSRERIDAFLAALAAAGLLRPVGRGDFEMHPALTGFLHATVLRGAGRERDRWARGFVEVLARYADALAPRPLRQQKSAFRAHRANFQAALAESARLGMDSPQGALLQTLGAFALNLRRFDEAAERYAGLAEVHRRRGDQAGEAAAYHQLGTIAGESRDWEAAEGWYSKSLAIEERIGNEPGAALTYHQLGRIAQERGDLEGAEGWYRKSLEIRERIGDEAGAASTYHQLGRIAGARRDWEGAHGWYRRSLEINQRIGNEPDAAGTYHQLGRICEEQGDWECAKGWYRKSLAISERIGDEHGAALTYHQLGRVCEEMGDLQCAESWYRRSLEIKERLGNEHGAAGTYGQLGVLAGLAGRCEEAGAWILRGLRAFIESGDEEGAERQVGNFHVLYRRADPQARGRLRAMWEEDGLGELPAELDSAPDPPPSAPPST